MSRIPIMARVVAAPTADSPWSSAWGIRWVPIRPLVVAPQIANVSQRRQKSPWRRAALRGTSGASGAGAVAGGPDAPACPVPKGASPRAAGGQPRGRGRVPHEQGDEGHRNHEQTAGPDPADRLPAEGRDDQGEQ